MKIGVGFLSEALLVALALPASIIANRVLGPADRGVLAVILIYSSLAASVVSLQWERNVKISIANGHLNAAEVLFKTSKILPLMSIVGVLLVLVAVALDGALSFYFKIFAVGVSIALIPLPILGQVLLNILLGTGLIWKYYKVKIAGQISYLIAILILYYSGRLNIMTAALSVIALWSAVTLFSWIGVKSQSGNLKIDSSKKINVVDAGAGTNLLEILSTQLPVIIAAMMLGYEVAGVFSAFKLFELPLQILFVAMANITLQNFKNSDKLKLLSRRQWYFVLVVVLLGLLVFHYISEYIIYHLLGSGYSLYSNYALAFVIAGMFNGFGVLLSQELQLKKDKYRFYKLQGLDGFFKILIIMVASYLFGVAGFFVGYAASSFIRMFFAVFFLTEKDNE